VLSATEAAIIKELITQKIDELCGQTPQEYCEGFYGESPDMNGIS